MMPKPARTIVYGYYGWLNYGDDLFVAAVCLGYARFRPDSRVKICAPNLASIQNVGFVLPAWTLRFYSRAGRVGQFLRLLAFIGGGIWADHVLFGGGSVFSSDMSAIWRAVLPRLQKNGRRMAAVGVSLGPYRNEQDRRYFTGLLNGFDCIAVRDRASFELAGQMGLSARVVEGADLAGCYAALRYDQTAARGAAIGVSLCNLENVPHAEREAVRRASHIMIEAVGRVASERRAPVRLFVLNAHPVLGDHALMHDAARELARKGVTVDTFVHHDSAATWQALAACAAIVSVRLHAAVTAYLSSVPFVLLEYHRKCTDFLDDVGQPAALRVSLDAVDEPAMVQAIDGAMQAGCPAPGLPPADYSRKAMKNFAELLL